MSNTKQKFLAAAALAVTGGMSHAAIMTIGTSQTVAPTAIPTINVAPGGTFKVDLWGKAQGTGFVLGVGLGIYQSSAASFNGGLLSASNILPAGTVYSGAASFAFGPDATSIFNGTTSAPVTAPAQPAGNSGSLVIATLGGAMSTSPAPAAAFQMTATQSQYIGEVTGTATLTPGTYYLYLGRSGSAGITESVPFKAASFIGNNGNGSTVSNTSLFGTDDQQAVATGGIGSNGTSNNVLSPKADAIIVVASLGASLSLTTPAVAPVTVVPGTGTQYLATLLGDNGSFALGGTPSGDAIVGFDFSGGTVNFGSLPNGASVLGASAAAPYITLFNSLKSGASYDVIVDLGANNTSGNLVLGSLPAGVTLSGEAAVPEPTTISLAGIGAVLAMSRRRRQQA